MHNRTVSPAPPYRAVLRVAVVCLALWCATAAGRTLEADPRLQDAHQAWERGDYPAALRGYLRLLDTPDADRLLPAIALQTGELFHTLELTADGGAPQFSADGRYLAYEIGRGDDRHTRIAPVHTPAATLAELPGYGASFSPDGSSVTYLGRAARTASGARPSADATATQIVVWRLSDGAERRLDDRRLRVTSLAAGIDDTVLVAAPDVDGIEQLYVVALSRQPRALTSGSPGKVLHEVNATGTAALFTERPQRPGTPAVFGLVTLPEGTVTMLRGSAPAFSADGHSLVWSREENGESTILVAPVAAPRQPAVVRAGPDRIDRPALSPDGRRIAFQIMHRHDWELHVIERDGSGERRVTDEVQHDVMPRFLTSDRLLGLMGEFRHRRSFLHDLTDGSRMRLFHNNTVRTIAPEYDWAVSPDGSQLLVVADRDGDTVSPERGVYLMDLTRTVTAGAVRARLVANLAAEEALLAHSRRLFAPLAGDVRSAAGEVSRARIREYQEALFAFGSKHISQPGNRKAAEYLLATYRSFGYQPEYQWFEPAGALGGRTANVLATLGGTTHPEIVYVVGSHYDSVAASPGADDNSSGTAALLETARVLAGRPQAATIVFASFTGEESGLLGSREFVRRAIASGTRITGVLNNDMIGWANDGRLDNTIRHANAGIRDVLHAAALQFTDLITYDARYVRGTDAHAFHERYGGIVGGIGSYPVLGNPHYHQPSDVLDTIDHQLVTEVAKTTAAGIMLLASSPAPVAALRARDAGQGRTALSWSPNGERDVTGYVIEWQGPAGGPARRLEVAGTSAEIQAPAGARISIKAVNRRGLESWAETAMVLR